MGKNEIIKIVLESLLQQRVALNSEITKLNYNESCFFYKKTSLIEEIDKLDIQIQNNLMSLNE